MCEGGPPSRRPNALILEFAETVNNEGSGSARTMVVRRSLLASSWRVAKLSAKRTDEVTPFSSNSCQSPDVHNAASPRSSLRMRMASSTFVRKILPSPIFPVRAEVAMV